MKKMLSVLGLVMMAAVCHADVLMVEDFDYPIGDKITSHGWYTQYEGESPIGVTNGLSVGNYAQSGIGNAALIDCLTSTAQPHKAFAEVREGDVYVAFMLLPALNSKDGYFFALRDSVSETSFNYLARVFVSAKNQIGLCVGKGSTKVYSTEVMDASTTYLVVVKYSIVDGSNNDAVSVYLLTDALAEEPDEPTVGPLRDSAIDDIYPRNIVLRGYDANSWLVVDGIRVATTWQEAVLRKSAAAVDRPVQEDAEQDAWLYNCLGTCIGRYSEALLQAQVRGMYIIKSGNSSRKVLR